MIKRVLKKIYIGIILARALSSNLIDALRFLSVFYRLPFVKRTGAYSAVIPLTFNAKRILVDVSASTDFAVMKEIFLDKEYEPHSDIAPRVILDLGANTGFSVIYWKLLFPGAVVHAYEPDPMTFKKLTQNTRKFSNVVLYNEALGISHGDMEFYVHPESSISSSFVQREAGSRMMRVPTVTLDVAIKRAGIVDLIKYDIEGAEFGVFGSSIMKKDVPVIIGEVHEDLGGKKLEEFLDSFFGFEKRISQTSKNRYIVELTK